MKTVAQLSQRQRNRFALLARLGVPLELRWVHSGSWEDSYDLEEDADWLIYETNKHSEWYIRRKPK